MAADELGEAACRILKSWQQSFARGGCWSQKMMLKSTLKELTNCCSWMRVSTIDWEAADELTGVTSRVSRPWLKLFARGG